MQREMRMLEHNDEMRDRDEVRREATYQRELDRAGEARRRVEAMFGRLSRDNEELAREDWVRPLGAEEEFDQAEVRMRDRIRALRELADHLASQSTRQQ